MSSANFGPQSAFKQTSRAILRGRTPSADGEVYTAKDYDNSFKWRRPTVEAMLGRDDRSMKLTKICIQNLRRVHIRISHLKCQNLHAEADGVC